MVQVNFGKRTIDCRLVYYGPEGAGKTASLKRVNERTPARGAGQMTAINSETERTLFFEYMPMRLGKFAARDSSSARAMRLRGDSPSALRASGLSAFDGMNTTVHIYTVPGRPNATSTRMTILRNVDAIVFVADSREGRMEANLEAKARLREELRDLGHKSGAVPVVMQWNHRDADDALPLGELEILLNPERYPSFATSAMTGEGVLATLKKASLITLEGVGERFGLSKTRKVSRASLKVETPRRTESTRMRAVREQVAKVTRRVEPRNKIRGVKPARRSLTERLFG